MGSGQVTRSESSFAISFFLVTVAVFTVAGSLGFVLVHFSHFQPTPGRLIMPSAFWISTLALACGSAALHRAHSLVRIERQRPFRRFMLVAMISGTVFVGLQSFGLWCLMQNQLPKNAETGQNAFVFVFAAMHGIHFIVALLFLIFVTLHALNDRYDHEYFWGVTVCKYFWHCLGVVWCAILGVIAIGM